MIADGGQVPASLSVTEAGRTPAGQPPVAETRLVAEAPDFFFPWESHAVRISWGGRAVDLIMGLRTAGTIHWWQAARLMVLEESAACRVIEMGGAIPLKQMRLNDLQDCPSHANPFLHKHNWLNGHLSARLHANGVCEVFAHFINSKFFDDGLPLRDAVPVIGIRSDTQDDSGDLCGPLDGSRTSLRLGEVEFDLTDAAHLATPQQPGCLTKEGDFLIWQPFRGMELYAGEPTREITGDEYVCRAEDQVIPRGLARTLRFNFSLNPDRSPRVARYLPPDWWYGLCEEFLPQAVLPVSNEFDGSLQAAMDWRNTWSSQAGFDDGSVARHAKRGNSGRFEPGWEGETPYAHMLQSWRTGDAQEYDQALRSCYFFTDVCVDHAAKMVRMHAYPPNAFSVPMARVQSCVAAWLETGDAYALDTARAVIDTAYWVHKNSWPRLAVGRDACFIRGAIFLYRYLDSEHYRAMARDALRDTLASQNPDGSFGDQGGGSGVHQWSAYIVKPWMGLMATNPMLDYLELFPDEPDLLDSIRRFGEWLLRERHDHAGIQGWSYQHYFRGGLDFIDGQGWTKLKGGRLWHNEYLARFLGYCALRFNRAEYLEAWEESYRGNQGKVGGDYEVAPVLQFIPWLQAKLWQVTVDEKGLVAHPVWFGSKTPESGIVSTPFGRVELRWSTEAEPHPVLTNPDRSLSLLIRECRLRECPSPLKSLAGEQTGPSSGVQCP
jgi:hypothetical protein